MSSQHTGLINFEAASNPPHCFLGSVLTGLDLKSSERIAVYVSGSDDLRSQGTQYRRSVVQVLVVRVDIGVMIYEAMTPQCRRSVVQVLVVRVDIGVVIYEAMTGQCRRSVVQVLVLRVDIGVVIYAAMTPQCGRSVVQVLVVRVDIGVVTYEAMTPQCGRSGFRSWLSEWI